MGKVAMIILGGIVVGAIFAGIFIFNPFKTTTTVTTPTEPVVEPTPTLTPIEFTTYTSESGFQFDYPETVSLTENAVDSSEYADLTLTTEDQDGSIAINISDTKLKTLADWTKLNKIASESADTKTATLVDIPATEIIAPDSIKLIAIDQGVLYEITALFTEQSKDSVMELYAKILESFQFVAPTAAAKPAAGSSGASSGADSSGDIILEEDVVE